MNSFPYVNSRDSKIDIQRELLVLQLLILLLVPAHFASPVTIN
jgi:hypothetical protein